MPDQVESKQLVGSLRERVDELEAALETHDLSEVADACCQLFATAARPILSSGLTNVFGRLIEEAHLSNLSKTLPSEAEALRQAELKGGGVSVVVLPWGDQKRWALRTADGRVVLPTSYHKPNWSGILSTAEATRRLEFVDSSNVLSSRIGDFSNGYCVSSLSVGGLSQVFEQSYVVRQTTEEFILPEGLEPEDAAMFRLEPEEWGYPLRSGPPFTGPEEVDSIGKGVDTGPEGPWKDTGREAYQGELRER